MRRWPKPLIMLVVAFLPLRAAAQGNDPVQRHIARLEEAWIQAVVRRDAAAFDRMLASRFVYTENDRVYSRAALIKEITTGADTVTSGRNEDLIVRVYGSTAIATGWLVLIGRSGGKPFERHYRYTDTWERINGRWRVIAAHDYLKP